MKQKRIDFIVKAKGVLTSVLSNKAARIKRAVEAAIANTEDAIIDTEARLETIMTEFGNAAGAGESSLLNDRINQYLDVKAEIHSLKQDLKELQNLKAVLYEEIDVEEDA